MEIVRIKRKAQRRKTQVAKEGVLIFVEKEVPNDVAKKKKDSGPKEKLQRFETANGLFPLGRKGQQDVRTADINKMRRKKKTLQREEDSSNRPQLLRSGFGKTQVRKGRNQIGKLQHGSPNERRQERVRVYATSSRYQEKPKKKKPENAPNLAL